MSETFFTWPSLMNNDNVGIWVVELATCRKVKLPGSDKGAYPTTGGEWFVWEDCWDTTQWGYSRVYAFNLRKNGLLGPDGHLVPE